MVGYAEEETGVAITSLKQLFDASREQYLSALRESKMPKIMLREHPGCSFDEVAERGFHWFLVHRSEFFDDKPPLPFVLTMASAFRAALLTVLRELKG